MSRRICGTVTPNWTTEPCESGWTVRHVDGHRLEDVFDTERAADIRARTLTALHMEWGIPPLAQRENDNMGLIAMETGGGDFQPAPHGTHVARCFGLIDLGTQTSTFGAAHKVLIRWELCAEAMEDGRPFEISKFYTVSLHEKASLRKDLQAWRGRAFTEEELTGFALKNILGKCCLLSIVGKASSKEGQGDRSVVGAVMALPKGTTCPPGVNPPIVWDMDSPNWSVYAEMPEWLRKRIDESDEMVSGKLRRPGTAPHPVTEDDPDDPFAL